MEESMPTISKFGLIDS